MSLKTEKAYTDIKDTFERGAAVNIVTAAKKLRDKGIRDEEVEVREKAPQFTPKAKVFLLKDMEVFCKSMEFSYDEKTKEIVAKLVFK